MASAPDSSMIHYLRTVRTRVGIVHRFLLAQEFRLLAAMLVVAPVPWLMGYGQDHARFADRHVLQGFQSDGGLAAFGWMPEVVRPAVAERGFRVCESREVLEMEGLQATRIRYFVVNQVRQRFPDFNPILFRCFHTRLGGALHRDIRREGGGLYDYDGVEAIRFSSSDGSHPTDNGRVYLIAIPWGWGWLKIACQVPIALFGYVLVRKRVWPWARERYRRGMFVRRQ